MCVISLRHTPAWHAPVSFSRAHKNVKTLRDLPTALQAVDTATPWCTDAGGMRGAEKFVVLIELQAWWHLNSAQAEAIHHELRSYHGLNVCMVTYALACSIHCSLWYCAEVLALVGARMSATWKWPDFSARMDSSTFSMEASFLLAAPEAPRFRQQTTPALAVALQWSAPVMPPSLTFAAFNVFRTRWCCDNHQYRGTDPITATYSCHSSCLLCAIRLAIDHHHVLF